MRPIDADALIWKFAERFDEACEQMHTRKNKDYWYGVSVGVNWGKNTIADEPAVDAAEVVRWIPVSERLPEVPLQTVLVTNGKETCVAVYSAVYDEFGVMCGRGQDKRFGVTHWMPLPPPPKEK